MILQKSPLGVLGALALKVLGTNPDKFSDTLTPIADLYDQYLADEQTIIIASATITTAQREQTMQISVPIGECWRLIGYSVYATLASADAALTSSGLIELANGIQRAPILADNMTGLTGGGGRVEAIAELLSAPRLLPGGWSVFGTVILSALPTVATAVQMRLIAQRIVV